jgi:hypothetical protein
MQPGSSPPRIVAFEGREKFSWTIKRWIEILASDDGLKIKEAAN